MSDFEIKLDFNASMSVLTPPAEAELLGQVDQFKRVTNGWFPFVEFHVASK
jgi:hypothetical protein